MEDNTLNFFMSEAIKEAYLGIENHHGGPFGAVVVKDGTIIGRGHNCVVRDNDCTCHGEMMAIRDACKNQSSFNLSYSEIYTTAEPCPMCLGAILWAGISTVYYGCNKVDTKNIGFGDNEFYNMINGSADRNYIIQELERDECIKIFEKYKQMKDNTKY